MSGEVQGFRLSPQQRRIWRLQGDSRAFRAQCAVEVAGPLDEERLRQALAAAMVRHDVLRTTFRRSPGIRFPIQVIGGPAAPLWQSAGVSASRPAEPLPAASELLRQAAARPFDLERGPVVHAWLAALAADRHLLVLALPALCADRASLDNLVAEIAAGYAGAGAGAGPAADGGNGGAAGATSGSGGGAEEPVQYVQFSEWQHELLASEESRSGREFWRAQARPGLAALALPLEGRGGAGGFAPERLPLHLDADTQPRLEALSGSCGAQPAQVLLAAWQALLWRLSGEPDGGTGVLFDGRPHAELAAALGPFARVLPIPWQLPAGGSFRQLVERTRLAWEEAADWQECFGEDEPAAAGAAACFELAESASPRRAGEVVFNQLRSTVYGERFKVCLSVVRGGGGLAAEILYDSRLLAAEAAATLGERFNLLLRAVLAGGAADPARQRAGERAPAAATVTATAFDEVELLTPGERQALLVDFNATSVGAAGAGARPAHRLIAEQAARAPGALAVERGERRLSFGELDARANQLAHYLAGEGIGRESLVGLAVERSPEMIVGILGILKAGAAYLPLDATYPPERLAFMLADARVAMLLTQQSQVAALPAEALAGMAVLCLDSEWQGVSALPASDPRVETAPDNLAYVIYTSGSTGRPKGVMVTHGALANYLAWAVAAYGLGPRAGGDGGSGGDSDGGGDGSNREGDEARRGAPVHSPLGFDLTVTSLLAPLAAGEAVTLIGEELGIEPLAAALRREGGFRVLKITPAHLGLLQPALAAGDLAGRVGTLVVGGEALPAAAVSGWQRWAPATRIVNEYGPTEATVGCSAYVVPTAEFAADAGQGSGSAAASTAPSTTAGASTTAGGTVPIGRPIADARMYLLDAGLRPVPAGVPGEIYVGGAGLARGYLARPDLTAERFVPDPFAGGPAARAGERLYRTGDLGRFLPGGVVEFLGRNDHQVKVRGFRVELREIEAVLVQHPQVREAVVAAREDTPGETRLAAYLVAAGEPAPNVDELRRFLAAKLPDYMVPAVFVPLPALPLTANGKLDRAALPAPGSRRPDLEKAYVAPRSPVEESLAEIWSEVLGLDRIGVLDSFFALGGDSIRSVRAVALAKERGLEVSVEQLFRRQTIEALAADLAAGETAGAAAPATASAASADEAALSRLVAAIEGLSEEEVGARLREQAANGAEEPPP